MVIQSFKRLANYTREQFNRFIANLKYPPNKFQYAVLEKIAFGAGNITVDAKAGAGKTQLLIMVANLLLDMGIDPSEVMFQAFNKSIEEELNKRLPKGFTAKTSHSLGLAMCREYAAAQGVKLTNKFTDKKYEDIAKYIAERIHPGSDEEEKRFKAMITVKKLIGFMMANDVDPDDITGIEDTAYHYGLDITPAMVTWMPYAIEKVIERFVKFGEMDFIDMIYMPVKLKMEPKSQYRFLLVDESQDLNQLQQEISGKLLHPEGRIVVVGDPNQAIYGFAAADAEAFQNLAKRFSTTVLELNTCYRCPTSHIQLAQSLVPTIEAAPNAIEGTIEFKHLDLLPSMPLGSMVICRLNAPLVAAYFQFIASEKPAVIIGRDMGKGLLALVDKVAEMEGFSYYSITHFIDRYFDTERLKLEKKPNGQSKVNQLQDQIACLKVCVDNFDCTDLECFKEKLETLFVDFKDKGLDKSKVVTLCTVHRAKGLEADHIGLIYQRNSNGEFSNIMPLVWEKQRAWELEQEFNIKYVALTRAKQILTFFGGYKPGQDVDITEGDELALGLEVDENFEDEDDFDIEGGDKVYFTVQDIEDDEEDEPMTAFALAEQVANNDALLESLADEEDDTESIAMNAIDIETLEVVDERLEKASHNLKRGIRFLRSAKEATEDRDRKDYLISAEIYVKDFDVEVSKVNLPRDEKLALLGEENNRLFTFNSLHTRVYNLLGDSRKIVETHNYAIQVLESFSKVSEPNPEEAPIVLPPRKPSVSELVRLPEVFAEDETAKRRAVAVAQRLLSEELWDGETPIHFKDPYETHSLVMSKDNEGWITTLIVTSKLFLANKAGEIVVSLPVTDMVEHSPEDEKLLEVPATDTIPTEPVEWAKWMLANLERIAGFDTETTDKQTNPNNFEIVQAGVIRGDGEVLFNRYISPYVSRISEGALAVHGISHQVLRQNGALSLISEYENLKTALSGKIVIAYNSPFDKAALENSLKLCGLAPIEVHSWHCAMRMYAKHNPTKVDARGRRGTNWKLVEAVAQQGLPVSEDAHDALADVKMTLALIQSMATDSPDRWQVPKALPAPASPKYAEGDYVRVKASGVVMQVMRLMENGELNLVDPDNERQRQTVRPSMVEAAEKPQAKEGTVESPVVQAPPKSFAQLKELLAETPKPEPVVIVQPKKATPEEELERLARSFGNRAKLEEFIALLESIKDEVFPTE